MGAAGPTRGRAGHGQHFHAAQTVLRGVNVRTISFFPPLSLYIFLSFAGKRNYLKLDIVSTLLSLINCHFDI